MVKENGEKGIAVSLLPVEWRGGFECSNLCVSRWAKRQDPLKLFHSRTVRAVLDFHYSHSTFSFPVLLKTNIAEFQEAHTRKVLPLFLHLHFQAVSFGPHWQPLIKVDGPLVRPEPVSISVISFKSVLRISLLCTTSETILDPALYSSYFYFQFGKNKPVWCPSLFFCMVCAPLELKKCLPWAGTWFQRACTTARKASRNIRCAVIQAPSLFRLWVAWKRPNLFGLSQRGKSIK